MEKVKELFQEGIKFKKIASFVTLLTLSLSSFAAVVPQAEACGAVCPQGDVKYEIGGGYEYTDGSATIWGDETTVYWAATEGCAVTNVCIKIGGPGGGSLINPNAGLGQWSTQTYGISHVVLTTDCQPAPFCGNGTIESGEFCDDGENNGEYGYCNQDCTALGPYCGDGNVDDPYEECEADVDCFCGEICTDCQCVSEPQQKTDVTLCKEDNEGTKLGGWELSLVSESETFSGTTEGQCKNTGCVTFEDVPYGTYEIEEVLKEGWENVSGLGQVEISSEDPTFTIVNKEKEGPETVTVKAYKVTCESEADLPNWGDGGPDITETSAQDFVNGNQNCHLEEDWSFEWAYAGTANPGDNIIGPAGGAWTTFGPTDSNGLAITSISSLSGDRIWVREVMQEGYIAFSGDTSTPRDNVSAEMYCHEDVLNYDNYDYIINPVLGETYYCVAFNAPEGGITTYNLTASTTGFGWITSDPAGINCGYEAFDCEEEYEEGTEVTLTATPGGGQKFDGWGGDCSGTSTVCVLTMDGAKSVTAAFSLIPGVITYTVTFDGNGGTPTSTDVVVMEGESVDPLPTVTRDGYDFVEWNTASDGSGDTFTNSTPVIADITVYAIWQPTSVTYYTVTFIDGTTTYATRTVADGQSVGGAMPANPTKTGYTFVGWNTQSDGQGSVFTSGTVVTGDITVYAVWQEYVTPPVYGCTDPVAYNYNPDATADDGSCVYTRSGGYAGPAGVVLGEEVEECGIYLYEYIQYGADNNPYEVRKLQAFLNLHMGSSLPITGIYDLATMDVLSQFQVRYKDEVLRPWVEDAGTHCDENEPTGYVYKTTKRWINLIMCPTLDIPMPDLSDYFPKADCSAYWQAVLGEEVTAAEDGVSDGAVADNATEENGTAEAEGPDELAPEDEEIIQLGDEVETENREREIPISWLILVVILVVAALIWFVLKGMKR